MLYLTCSRCIFLNLLCVSVHLTFDLVPHVTARAYLATSTRVINDGSQVQISQLSCVATRHLCRRGLNALVVLLVARSRIDLLDNGLVQVISQALLLRWLSHRNRKHTEGLIWPPLMRIVIVHFCPACLLSSRDIVRA